MKGYGPDVAEEVIGRLRELGMIDDAAFAGMLARDRVRLRPQGSRRLANELRQKGVDEETARAAIRETMEGEETDERELARRAAAKWKPRPGEEPERARRRLHGFLARRGFDGEIIREVLDETLPDDVFQSDA
jgi:regulatory protein